jgi:retron-type reverse transcriptase
VRGTRESACKQEEKVNDQWYSGSNLHKAWRYAKIDMRDNFTFDIIDYRDISDNIDTVLKNLNTQLRQNQYYPAPLLSVEVPKNDHTYRPGSSVAPVDLIVLYAIAQQLAPPLDKKLSASAYAYRLNPKRDEEEQPLFSGRPVPEAEPEGPKRAAGEDEAEGVGFPYDWFSNWIQFDHDTQSASRKFKHAASSDIAAYFENISLTTLHAELLALLGEDYKALLERLFFMLDFWSRVESSSREAGRGLPQGNDVSSFLSNIYLRRLDEAMLSIVDGDAEKYLRYVDDIKFYTSDRGEARRGLVVLQRTLRSLGLNVQTAKTRIRPAADTTDAEVNQWMEHLGRDSEDRLESARLFVTKELDVSDPDRMDKWRRVYARCLTILGEADDDAALPVALQSFCSDPTAKTVERNYTYLRRFSTRHSLADRICERLSDAEFTFGHHRAKMYQLAAYSRGDSDKLTALALRDASDESACWMARVGALLFLMTCALSPSQLGQISEVVKAEGNTQVLRAAYVTLCQHSGKELRFVLDQVSYLSGPHQDYFRRYFFRLAQDSGAGENLLKAVKRENPASPLFIRHLHPLDLIKANGHVRSLFHDVVQQKLQACIPEWPRLRSRLGAIYNSFVDHP